MLEFFNVNQENFENFYTVVCFIQFWTTFIFSKNKNFEIFLSQKKNLVEKNFLVENFYTVMCFIQFWATFIFSKKKSFLEKCRK